MCFYQFSPLTPLKFFYTVKNALSSIESRKIAHVYVSHRLQKHTHYSYQQNHNYKHQHTHTHVLSCSLIMETKWLFNSSSMLLTFKRKLKQLIINTLSKQKARIFSHQFASFIIHHFRHKERKKKNKKLAHEL